ncbi:hypothetical protein WA577_006157 [Blastocystis sp. JDR]
MVVLLAAVLTKSGKVLISRQYVNMNRMRVEGILAVFPKLMGETNKQHTFVEANNMRYVYQPIENLVVLVVTTKNSNIIEDLETLRTLAKLVPEYAGSVQEEAVVDHAFDLIFALDELITYGGMNETIPLQQVRVNLAMESHEEKLLAMVQESKMNQAKEIMKQKEKEIKSQQPAASGFGFFSSLFSTVSQTVRSIDSAATKPAASRPVESYVDTRAMAPMREPTSTPSLTRSEPASTPSLGRGMQLSGAKKDSLSNLMREDHLVVPSTTKKAAAAPVSSSAVDVKIEEELTVKLSRDGLIETADVKGTLSVRANAPEASRVLIRLNDFAAPGFQLQLHPTIARSFLSDHVLTLKQADRGFPVDSSVSVLRWRQPNGGDALVPLSVTCWPEVLDDGCNVNVEYTLNREVLPALSNVRICIPLPAGASPEILSVDGSYHFYPKESFIEWEIEEMQEDNANGVLEFHVKGGSEDDFFPTSVEFESPRTFLDASVVEVLQVADSAPVSFSQSKSMRVSTYTIA